MHVKCARSIWLGRVPNAFFDHLNLSNVSELIFDSDLYALLRLCGAGELEIGEHASDYDRFKAFCNAAPMLLGHPIIPKIATLLKSCFGIDLPCSPDTCDEIWRIVSDKLTLAPMTGWDCVKAVNQMEMPRVLLGRDQLVKMDMIPTEIEPVLCGNTLIHTAATNWGAWETEMSQAIERCIEKGSHSIYFKISDALSYDIPSLYHVEQALRGDHNENIDLLLTQALRQLCLICCQKGLTLYLEIESKDASRVVLLLERIYKSVGLPNTVFFSREISTVEAMIALSGQIESGFLRLGFMTAYYPSDRELEAAYDAIIARYPAGMLHVFYGDDLRYSAYETNRFKRLMS